MAIIGNSYFTLADQMRREGMDGGIDMIVEALAKLNVFMMDATVVSCQKGTSYESTVRSGLPDVAWGRINKGTPMSKSSTRQHKESTGFVEGLASVDTRLLELAGPAKAAAIRASEAIPFLEAIAQEVESMIFYGNTGTNPDGFNGLGAWYNQLPVATNNASNQVISAGGSGSDNTSIWFVTHGEQHTFMLTPETMPAGIQREDKGEQRVTDASGNPFFVKEELFRQNTGLFVKDWRKNARIANIDVSNVVAGSVGLFDLLSAGWHKAGMPSYTKDLQGDEGIFQMGKTVIYMNRTMFEQLDRQSRNATIHPALHLTMMELEGREVPSFRGLPIRVTDALLNTETLVA
jgi:hypothetical protein